MDKIKEFKRLFEQYNTHTNLMSKNEIKKLEMKHIPDCMSITKFFEKYSRPKTLLDIGTGGGFPAIPIALFFSDIQVYAIDSIKKKINFIEEVKNKADIQNIHPVCVRIENFDKKNFFDAATTRAVARLSVILNYCTPFVKLNGHIIAYKSKSADIELLEAEAIIESLGLQYLEKINYVLSDSTERCLLIFKKIKEINSFDKLKNVFHSGKN